jgi:hypothetical protein
MNIGSKKLLREVASTFCGAQAYWTHPHYDHYREGWQCHEGHWDHEDHDNRHWRDHDHGRGHRDHDEHEHEDRD